MVLVDVGTDLFCWRSEWPVWRTAGPPPGRSGSSAALSAYSAAGTPSQRLGCCGRTEGCRPAESVRKDDSEMDLKKY